MHLSSALGSVMDVPVVAATRLKGRISLQDNYFLLDFFKIRLKELIQLIPRNHLFRLTLAFQLGIASIVEVAMVGVGDDEKFLVPRHWIWLADCIISSGLTQTLQQCQDQKDQQLPYCIDISILFYSIKQIISYIKNCLMALNYIHSKGPNYCHGIESLPISIF